MSKKCTPLWREAHFEVKMYKTHHCRTTFGSWDVEKVHAVVARSTFRCQNVQNTPFSFQVKMHKTPCSDHFWRFRCRKSARRCGAKHISMSKCTKRTIVGPLLEVEMLKKCTPLWREAHFDVKMYKTHHSRTTFGSWDVEKVHAVVARSIFPSQNAQNTMFGPLLEVQMSKKCTPLWREAHFEVKMLKAPGFWTTFGGSNVASLHYTTLHYTPLHYNTLHYTTLHNTTTTTTQLHSTKLHHTKLHYTTLHYPTLHYTTLHYTTLHYTTLPSATLHYITLHSTTLQLQLHNYTPLQYTPLHSTTLNYTTLHYTTLHYTPLHYTTLHYTTLPSTTLHYITLHYTTLQLQLRLRNYTPLHYITLHYITLHYTPLHYITLHYITLLYTTFHYTSLHYTTLRYIPLHSATLHYITLHYITLNDTAPQIDR